MSHYTWPRVSTFCVRFSSEICVVSSVSFSEVEVSLYCQGGLELGNPPASASQVTKHVSSCVTCDVCGLCLYSCARVHVDVLMHCRGCMFMAMCVGVYMLGIDGRSQGLEPLE